jgi:hypothetical protein
MLVKINGDLFHEIYNKVKKEPNEINTIDFSDVFDKAKVPEIPMDEALQYTDQIYNTDTLISAIDKMIYQGMSKTEITEFLFYYISDVTHETKEAIDMTVSVVSELKKDAVISSQYALDITEQIITAIKHGYGPVNAGILSFLKEFILTTISNI